MSREAWEKANAASEKWREANEWFTQLEDALFRAYNQFGNTFGKIGCLRELVTGAELAVELEAIRTAINETVNSATPNLQKMGDSPIGGDYERLSGEPDIEALRNMFSLR